MKVYLDTVGCRLNQAEIESMAGEFRAAGHEIVGLAAEAQLAVVNTCTVTGHAAADSRAMIRRIAAHGAGGIIVTGCWATMRHAEAIVFARGAEGNPERIQGCVGTQRTRADGCWGRERESSSAANSWQRVTAREPASRFRMGATTTARSV